MNYKLKIKKIKNNEGFTIIETMIAVALFSIVVTIGMGSLLNTTLLQKKSQDMRSIMDNLSFIMEDMSRNIRTGYDYSSDGGTQISFTASDGYTWTYIIESNNLSKSINGVPVQLNSSEITFKTGSGFTVVGAVPDDDLQPFVTIKLVGEITSKDNVVTPFSLQTSVSQRLIDIVL